MHHNTNLMHLLLFTCRVPTMNPNRSFFQETSKVSESFDYKSSCNVVTANNANNLASHIILYKSADKHCSLACPPGADQIRQADYRAGNGWSLMSFLRNCDLVTLPMLQVPLLLTLHVWQLSLPICVCYCFRPVLTFTSIKMSATTLLLRLSAFSNICFSVMGLKQPSTWLVEWRKADTKQATNVMHQKG